MPNLRTNTNLANAPSDVDMRRSRFDRSFSLKTSFNVGDLIPLQCEEILPGDTVDLQTNAVVRMQTLIAPVMDNMYVDIYHFFIPMRLVWNHTKEFFGENTQSAWVPQVTYTIPQITSPSSTGWNVGTIADYLGFPTGVAGLSVSALPFRAYALVCNEWFRSENLTDPLNIPVDDNTQTGSNGGSYVNDVANGGLPFKAAKYFDQFTGALPYPQKGPDVPLPVTYLQSNVLPVKPLKTSWNQADLLDDSSLQATLLYDRPTFAPITDSKYLGLSNSGYGALRHATQDPDYPTVSNSSTAVFANLGADASSLGLSVGTINELRTAFQIQKFYERASRGGSRYIEVIKSFFGITSPDYRLQRPEYLGGTRQAINVNAVTQTSASASGSTAQGNQAAYSVTHMSHNDFLRSFTEHGFLLSLAVVRYDHSYQQGIPRQFSRVTKFDYYWPVFANLGEAAILNKEIYAQGSSVVDADGNIVDEQVFGYQERWFEYRYAQNKVTGEMRSQYAASLDLWHLGDDYNSLPQLSDSWIREDKANVDRCLAVKSSVANQLFADFYFKSYWTRIMPVFSVPGLIDHH